MFEPDLLLSKEGRPIVIVEVKARPISPNFESAVEQQLQAYSTEAGTPWAVLADPNETRIFKRSELFTSLSTEEILKESPVPRPNVIGEQTLLLAIDQWLHGLPSCHEFLDRHPKLKEFADEIAGVD